jgi:hypothetical protein
LLVSMPLAGARGGLAPAPGACDWPLPFIWLLPLI